MLLYLRPARLRTFTRLGLGPSSLALMSQAVGLVLLVLLLAHGASRSTDAYFLQYSAGIFVSNAYIWGVAYPGMLQGSLCTQRALRRTPSLAAASACLSGAAAAYLLAVADYPAEIVAAAAPLMINAGLASVVATTAASGAARGFAALQAASNLVPNVGGCLALAATWKLDGPVRVFWMAVGMAAGQAALLAFIRLSSTNRARYLSAAGPTAAGPTAGGPTTGSRAAGAVYGASSSRPLLAKSFTGYGAGLLLQMSASQLPSGVGSIYNVALRFGSTFITVLINPLLPRLVNIAGTNRQAIGSLIRGSFVAAISGGILAAFVLADRWVALGTLGAMWVGVATCNACLGRAGYRELRTSFWWIPTCVVGATAAVTYLLVEVTGSAVVLASGLVGLELGSALVLSAALRTSDRQLLLFAFVVCGIAATEVFPAYVLAVVLAGGLAAVLASFVDASARDRLYAAVKIRECHRDRQLGLGEKVRTSEEKSTN